MSDIHFVSGKEREQNEYREYVQGLVDDGTITEEEAHQMRLDLLDDDGRATIDIPDDYIDLGGES